MQGFKISTKTDPFLVKVFRFRKEKIINAAQNTCLHFRVFSVLVFINQRELITVEC